MLYLTLNSSKMKSIVLIILVFSSTCVFAQEVRDICDMPQSSIERKAEFPGGIQEMYKYLSENLIYPKAAQRANVDGRVFVKFAVEKDGSIQKASIIKGMGLGFGCDEEAIRLFKSMPKWQSGRMNGEEVRVWLRVPVIFALDD